MKTAMQELIDYIDHMQNVYIKKSKETKDKNYQKGVEAILTATTLIKIQAKDNLEKEKEQIITAFEVGYKSCDLDETFEINRKLASGELHYNKTYNQNK
jgi:hypothetical protein